MVVTAEHESRTVDAVVVGSGHNGLITALALAEKGWDVLVTERNDRIGGATRSGEATLDGLEHDLYATNINLFLASPAFEKWGDDLARHGFRPKVSERSYANVFPDGKCLRVYQDQDRTEREIGAHDAADLEGWRALHERYREFMQVLMPLYAAPMPSVHVLRTVTRALSKIGASSLIDHLRLLTASTRELGETWLHSPEARALLATWGMHMDSGPDVSGGSMFPFIETFTDMEEGIAVAEGGISRLPEALAALLTEAGGRVETSADVDEILTSDGVARGVRLANGDVIRARRAVVANTTPTQLIGRLLRRSPDLTDDLRTRGERYRYGPGTMVVHLALSEPIDWAADDELSRFAYIHIAPYVDDLARTYQQSMAGVIPDDPLLIVGQTSQVDDTRSPDDRQVVWVQVRTLPSEIRGDSKNEISARNWADAKDAVADRVIDKLSAYAPGIKDTILARAVYSPDDLESANPNLVGGDSVAGSHHVWQNFLFRPWPEASTYEMPIDKLFLVGAATWPGGGTNGISGSLCAQRILDPHPYRRYGYLAAGLAAAGSAAVAAAARRKPNMPTSLKSRTKGR